MLEKLKIIQELSSIFAGVDVHLIPSTESDVRSFMREKIFSRLGAELDGYTAVTYICTLGSEHIYEFTSLPGITFLLYACKSLGKLLFIGPVTTESFSSSTLLAYLQQQNVPQNTVEQYIGAANRLPFVPISKLYRLMDVLTRHICGISLPIPVKKVEPSPYWEPLPMLMEESPQKEISHIRQVEDRYEYSSALTEAVKLGNLSLALQILHGSGKQFDMSERNRSPLRNMQNYCIVLNTQLRHALERSGIHPYELDRLSNEIGIQIERLSSTDMAGPFNTYIIEQYCRLVQEHSYQDLSQLTHQAVIYIKNNLSANITVKDTAKELSVHPDHLSHQFRKEMDMPFIAFLNRERCKQAASYLKHTSLQIKQISAIVGFNTISYFTKQFTHFYGKTPRDYRNERLFRK